MTNETKAPSFEQSLQTLEEIVQKLEGEELTLEQSLEAYEEGVRLTRTCEKALSDAEHKVQKLMDTGGEITAEPLLVADPEQEDIPF